MRTEPLISVVIASYNHAAFVGAALDSVAAQGIDDLEILVTDDASTDGTADVVAAHPDPRVQLHRHPRNRGACAAMNQAIGRARGRYVAVLNSDDIFLPGKLRAQLAAFEAEPGLGAVFGLPAFIDERGQPFDAAGHDALAVFRAPNRPRHAWLAHFFDHGNALCHPTALVRRQVYEALGPYDERLAQVPDLDMWVRLCRHHELHVLQRPCTGFRILEGQRNASAPRPEVVMRDAWERVAVLRRYLGLSAQEVAQVFPEYDSRTGPPAAFLALRALAQPAGYPFFHHFGLDALFDALPRHAPDEEQARQVREFIHRTGRTDLYRLYPPNPTR